jgi:hypothetical protein
LPEKSFKATSLPLSSVVRKAGALSLISMEISPRRTWLYRIRLFAVIFTLATPLVISLPLGEPLLHAQGLTQQYGRRQADKGPRALALVQISETGKARLIPITIMMDGKFFDAGSYKGTPVPMALDFGTVYEGFHSGVSQGLFTITQPGQLNHNWIAEGKWLRAGEQAPEKSKKYSAPVIDDDTKDDRPVLHRHAGSESKDKDEEKPANAPASPTTNGANSSGSNTTGSNTASSSTTGAAPAGSPTTGTSTTSQKTETSSPGSTSSSSPAPASKDTKDTKDAPKSAPQTARNDLDQPPSDPNRPILRRGKPDPNAHHEPFVNFDDPAEAAKATKEYAASQPTFQTITAISDAAGPDPRSYAYDVKPAEEAIYRNKMLELATKQLRLKPTGTSPASTEQPSGKAKSAAGQKKPSSAKPAGPQFDQLSLHIFDLSNSNEPILVLSARAHPPAITGNGTIPEPQEITLIARTNLEGELEKLFFAQTDSRHLDVRPRMELIDAVDADGDGRGELLFRQTSGEGSAYAIYRVTADKLYLLYEGAR